MAHLGELEKQIGLLGFGKHLNIWLSGSLFLLMLYFHSLLLFSLTKCKEDFQVDGFFVCTGFLWESINGDK
jgi:hypothetical protein